MATDGIEADAAPTPAPELDPGEDHGLRTLGEAVETILAATTREALLETAAQALRDLLAADEVAVHEARGVVGADAAAGLGRIVASRQALHVADARSDPRVDPQLAGDARSLLALPLVARSTAHAVLVARSAAPGGFAAQRVAGARALAASAGSALTRLALTAEVGAHAARHAALARAARTLNEARDMDAVLTALCREADLAIDGSVAGFYLLDEDGGGVGVAGHDTPPGWIGTKLAPGQGAGGQAIREGRPVVVDDYPPSATPGLVDVRSAVAVPVRWGGELRGALSVGFSHPDRRPGRREVESLEAIADLAAVACTNAEAFAEAELAARTDALTGVLNHGAMQARLAEEISRARRSAVPLSIALLDLDDFKSLNDRAGHLVGDQLLRGVADALAAEFRSYDSLARYGGDEFVVLLPGVDAAGARRAADRALQAVARATRALAVGDDGTLACSVGVAQWREPQSATELLDRADRALLLAKREGKARVVVATAEADERLALASAGSDLNRAFWDMVAASETPRESLLSLPAFVRGRLGLEEASLYTCEPSAEGSLERLASARHPGDPGPRALASGSLALGGETFVRLESGPVTRRSLAELYAAIDVRDHNAGAASPSGSYAAIGLARPDRPVGLLVLRASEPEFPRERLTLATAVASQALTVLLSSGGEGSPTAVTALAAAIDARDHYTHDHSAQVVELARDVARALGLPDAEVDRIRHGALLHDVGKVAIPNEVLLKEGPLDDGEWAIMREHPVIGEGILRRIPELRDMATIVRHEHERWDGGGYPDGLVGTRIPIGSRVILACDAYNAMITRRPYREPLEHAAALAELRRCAGSQFDPDVVEALVRVLAEREGPQDGA